MTDPPDINDQPNEEQDLPAPEGVSPQSPPRVVEEESTGNAALDARLAQGAVDFSRGIDTAQIWISGFLIVVLGSIASLALFQVPYHGLARALLVEDTALHRIATAAEHLALAPEAPLTLLSYGATWQIANGAVLGFHLLNLALHLIAAVLLFLVARQLLGRAASEPIAMTAGMLLAVHPLAATNLGMIVGRSGILAAVFILLALWIFLRGTAAQSNSRPGTVVAVLACFLLAYASEATALILPVLLIFADAIRGGLRRNAVAHLTFFAALAVLVAVRLAAGVGADGAYPQGLIAVLKAQSEYGGHALKYLFAPLGLLPQSPAALGQWNVLGAAAIVMSAYAGIMFSLKRSVLGLPFVWFAAVCLAAPCLLPAEELLGPRNAYLVVPGPMLLLPWALSRFTAPGIRAAAGIAAAALILACAWLNYREMLRYADPLDFWGSAAQARSTFEAEKYLAAEYVALSQMAESPEQAAALLDQAAAAYRAALDQQPDSLETQEQLGTLLSALGRAEEAAPLLEAVLRRRPGNPQVTQMLALHHARQLNETTDKAAVQAAMDWLRRAERVGELPQDVLARYGALLAGMGNFDDALVRLRQAHGDEHPIVKQLEILSARVRTLNQQSLELIQQNKTAEGLLRRAEMFAVQNRLNSALYLTSRVLEDNPSNAEAWGLLGYLDGAVGSAATFVERHAAQAPADATAWTDLARRTAAGGYWDSALLYIKQGAGGWDQPRSPELELARIALELDRPAKAGELVEEAAAAQPEAYEPQLLRAQVALARNEVTAAREHLDRAIELGAPEEEAAPVRAEIEDAAEAEEPVRTRIQ